MRSPLRASAVALFALLGLIASACGGGDSAETTNASGTADNSSNDAHAVAEANIDDLATSDDFSQIEVLDVDTGEPTTLAATVTGDRPVLLWFWAPH